MLRNYFLMAQPPLLLQEGKTVESGAIPLLVKGGVAARFNKVPRSIISRAQTGWLGFEQS
jgi:hypothetical protein